MRTFPFLDITESGQAIYRSKHISRISRKDVLEAFGIVAVAASLILVAFELRQNTNAARATAVQEATNVGRDQILMYARDPDIVRITATPYPELNELDQRRAFWINRSAWIGMQGIYRQHDLGVFPDEEWQFWTRVICANFHDEPDEYDMWPGNSAILAEDFVKFVEECASNVPGVLPQ